MCVTVGTRGPAGGIWMGWDGAFIYVVIKQTAGRLARRLFQIELNRGVLVLPLYIYP
jgi:hypothetical protein